MTRDQLKPGVFYQIQVGRISHQNWVKARYICCIPAYVGKRWVSRYFFEGRYELKSLAKVRRLTSRSPRMLNDAEIVSTFMQLRPEDGSGPVVVTPISQWWYYTYEVRGDLFYWEWYAKTPDLNSLHLVEAKLSNEQWNRYVAWFQFPPPIWHAKALLHADAPTKIRALASVLRESVEKGEPTE